jgi:hypothetical protein
MSPSWDTSLGTMDDKPDRQRQADSHRNRVRLIKLELDDLVRRQQAAIERLYQLREPLPRAPLRPRTAP